MMLLLHTLDLRGWRGSEEGRGVLRCSKRDSLALRLHSSFFFNPGSVLGEEEEEQWRKQMAEAG